MRILHVITTLSRGGAENQLVGLASLQRAAGHEVKIAYMVLEGYWRGPLEALGIEVVDLRARFKADPAAAWRLRRLIRYFSPTIINAHMQPAELCARLALLGTPAGSPPLIITRHNLNPFWRLPGEGAVGRWVARRADGIIGVSDAVKSLCDRNGCSAAAGKSTSVHNAIDATEYAAADGTAVALARKGWGAEPGDYVVGTAARLLPLKGIDVLIRGFAEYLSHARLQARLVIAGAGPQESELKALASAQGIEARVTFAGFREDMPTVMASFDVFALTSHREPFGMVVVEAMAAGRPVVATNAGGIPELVNDGINGILVPPRRPDDVARALLRLEDPSLRERLGAAGRAKARDRYGREIMFRRTMEFYAACLS